LRRRDVGDRDVGDRGRRQSTVTERGCRARLQSTADGVVARRGAHASCLRWDQRFPTRSSRASPPSHTVAPPSTPHLFIACIYTVDAGCVFAPPRVRSAHPQCGAMTVQVPAVPQPFRNSSRTRLAPVSHPFRVDGPHAVGQRRRLRHVSRVHLWSICRLRGPWHTPHRTQACNSGGDGGSFRHGACVYTDRDGCVVTGLVWIM